MGTARIHTPLVADVHFSAKLAVMAVECGADKLRVNPGNIGGEKEISYVADCVKAHKIPVRVGANTGSIEPHFLQKYGRSAEALVGSALQNVEVFERRGVENIVVSVKASDVPLTVEAYTLLAKRCPYPLHTGDLGIMDEDGFVYFRQRIKRMIITSGYNVYPSQLENILEGNEAVRMACVIGVPDPYKMQKIKAFVMLREGYQPTEETKQKILAYCKKNIAKYAMPYDIEFRDSLPTTLVGKVAYRVLEEEEAAKRGEKLPQAVR